MALMLLKIIYIVYSIYSIWYKVYTNIPLYTYIIIGQCTGDAMNIISKFSNHLDVIVKINLSVLTLVLQALD